MPRNRAAEQTTRGNRNRDGGRGGSRGRGGQQYGSSAGNESGSNHARAEELMRVHRQRAQEALQQQQRRQRSRSSHSYEGTAGQMKSESDRCILCANDLDVRILRPCGHNEVCLLCAARMRVLLKDISCPVCKQEAEHVVASRKGGDISFESFGTYGEIGGPHLILDETSGIFFDEEQEYQCTVELRRFKAGVGEDDAVFDSFSQLQRYLKEKHNKMICDVCFHHNHNFVMELPRMTFDEWKTHCKRGSKSSGFPGHTFCQFCKQRFYGDTELFIHMRDNHFHCDVCVQEGAQDIFFEHHRDVLQHYRQHHYVCEEPDCLEFPYRAFRSEADLISHMTNIHNKKLSRSDRRLDLWSGTSTTDQDLGGAGESYGNLDSNSELQEGCYSAASIIADSASFPSLPNSNASISQRALARAPPGPRQISHGNARMTEDDFPKLSSQTQTREQSFAAASWESSRPSPLDSDTSTQPSWGVNVKVKKGKLPKGKKTASASDSVQRQQSDMLDQVLESTPPAVAENDGAVTASSATKSTPTDPVSVVKKICEPNPLKFDEFRRLSLEFKNNSLSAEKYYDLIRQLFTSEQLKSFFPELIQQLSDADKRNKLHRIHQRSLDEGGARANNQSGAYARFDEKHDSSVNLGVYRKHGEENGGVLRVVARSRQTPSGSSRGGHASAARLTSDATVTPQTTRAAPTMDSSSSHDGREASTTSIRGLTASEFLTRSSPANRHSGGLVERQREQGHDDGAFPSLSAKSTREKSSHSDTRQTHLYLSSLARREKPHLSAEEFYQMAAMGPQDRNSAKNKAEQDAENDGEFGELIKGVSSSSSTANKQKKQDKKKLKGKNSKKVSLFDFQ
eukprot:gb/GECG01006598.1/.p1 GENE.gb/GECG01006598.1/~~gb/GECG01006598.1/.p1  ORF type:complete len:852 (+),score=113.98 gb/GECG01006598.1/:1-2556(+)